MFFWILVSFAVVALVLLVFAVIASIATDGDNVEIAFACGFLAFMLSMPLGAVWYGHAKDLGTVYAQHEVISVYETRVERLQDRLAGFDYHDSERVIQLNADSPVASVVEALTKAEEKLAYEQAVRAEAIRSIERRRRGPFSGVITLVGDYERELD